MLKSKWNKVISFALVTALLVMVVPASAMAAPVATSKITDVRQAVQLIESSYLGVDSNGTSYIKVGAANYIDPNVLAEITKGMNSVN